MAHDIMTTEEAAAYLRVGVDTLKRKARAGTIPAAKIGRSWRFQKKDLEAWLDSGGDLPEELVDWALVELVKERKADPADGWVTLDEVKRSLGK
jgi:excisionase family DNA binding protein